MDQAQLVAEIMAFLNSDTLKRKQLHLFLNRPKHIIEQDPGLDAVITHLGGERICSQLYAAAFLLNQKG